METVVPPIPQVEKITSTSKLTDPRHIDLIENQNKANNNVLLPTSKVQPSDYWIPPRDDIANIFRTGLKVNNSMSGNKVEFIPSKPGRDVTWYGCGPTVYDWSHMGHARTYLTFDIIRRIMTNYFGYSVFMCMNITDIDDKIIQRSHESGVEFAAFARHWEGKFWQDMRALNILLPDVITRVSEYIPEVIDFIQRIMDNGFAYESQGSVYFDTEKFRSSEIHIYGRMEPGSVNDQARVLEGEGALGIVTEKRCPLDFALWKKSKANEPSWDSPWGKGRPGWHIECSTMAATTLGFPIDIHSGGVDLRFPHHDNELAQSEACYNKPQWVNYFFHSGHLHIKGSKMSKSLKNFLTIQETLQEFSAREIRMLTLIHRWDAPMNYSPDGGSMHEAVELDRGFNNFFANTAAFLRNALGMNDLALPDILGKPDTTTTTTTTNNNNNNNTANITANTLPNTQLLSKQRWGPPEVILHDQLLHIQQMVHEALLDNFDTPTVVLLLKALVTDVNVYIASPEPVGPLVLKAATYVFNILKIFGVTNGDVSKLAYSIETSELSAEEARCTAIMDCLSAFRQTVRSVSQELLQDIRLLSSPSSSPTNTDSTMAAKFKAAALSLLTNCDLLRDEKLLEAGIQLEDAPSGPVWKRASADELKREQERKIAEDARRLAAKEEAQRKLMDAQTKKLAQLRIAPVDFFRSTRGDEFSAYDERGIPTISSSGEPISKSMQDKFRKVLEKHRTAHQTWLQDQTGPVDEPVLQDQRI